MVEAVDIPITAKMRLGWDDQNLTAPDLARALEDAGVSAIFVHGRTPARGFEGVVNLEGIRKVVEAVREIPVIGNGDVTTPEVAKHMIERLGAMGYPPDVGPFTTLIFLHTRQYLDPHPAPNPVLKKGSGHVQTLRSHGRSIWGRPGLLQFRKVAPGIPSVGPVKAFNTAVVRICSREDFERVLAEYLDWRTQFTDGSGELLPRYQMSPMVASFMFEDEKHQAKQRKAIAVPKGPVEVW